MNVQRLQFGSLIVDLEACALRWPDRVDELTPQEVLILRTLWAAPQRTCSQEDLYRAVWGYRSMPQGRALYYAMRRLRYKVEINPSKAVYLKTIRNFGYRLDDVVELPTSEVPTGDISFTLNPPPNYLTIFVGREKECQVLQERLTSEAFVTIVGAGGLGKTRLAATWASAQTDCNVAFCDLLDVHDSEGLASKISHALGFDTAPQSDPRALHTWIESRCDILLLDNAETLQPLLSDCINQWLTQLTSTKLLITSRKPIKANGEWVLPLQPLPHDSAVRLFRDRIIRAGGSVGDIEPLVRQLEGHPLLLELTAPKAAALGEAIVSHHLSQKQSVLHSIDPNRPERHQQLSNLLASTIAELEAAHLVALQTLSQLRGSFSLEICEILLGDEAYLSLEALIGHNLVQSERNTTPIRWRVPIYVRGALTLPTPDAQADMMERLCAHFEALLPDDVDTFVQKGNAPFRALASEFTLLKQTWSWARLNRTPDQYAKLSYILAEAAQWAGFIETTMDCLEQSFDVLPAQHPLLPHLTLLWARAAEQRIVPEQVLQRLEPLFKQDLTAYVLAKCNHLCIQLYAVTSRLETALLRLDETLELCRREGFAQIERSLATLAIGYSAFSEPIAKAESRAAYAKGIYHGVTGSGERLNLATQLNILDVYKGNLFSVLPRFEPLLERDDLLPWAKVWRRFFHASLQYEVGDRTLNRQQLSDIAADAEALGMVSYQAKTLRGLIKLLHTEGEYDAAHALAIDTLERFKSKRNPKANVEALALAAKAALEMGQPQKAWEHLVQLEPHEHYLYWPQIRLNLELIRLRTQQQMGLDVASQLSEIDALILATEAPLYRGRNCVTRSKLSAEMNDRVEQATWLEHAKAAVAELKGGCPLDLAHLQPASKP